MLFRRGSRWIVLAAGVAVLVPAGPADAECVYAVVYVTREGEPPVYVVGENDPCVTQTDYSQEFFLPLDGTTPGMPAGAPNGYFVDLRIPVP